MTPTVVTTQLTSLTNWSQANAAQVVGIQFQFTVPVTVPAATSCAVDVTIDDVKFGP